MSLLISDALAAAATATPQPNPWGSALMFAGFALIFYFLLWRPKASGLKHSAI